MLPSLMAPSVINGFSVRPVSPSPFLNELLGFATETDHVLIVIQLSGGNDGLNMVLPRDNYSAYFNARTNIAIPEAKILPLNGNASTGLHPAMTGLQALYNDGKLSIVQAVGYPNPNFSHFRATDIWMSATDANQVVNSGWNGRYLNEEYPNFPTGYPNTTMPDPLAIQIGSVTSLALQGPAFNMGMSITNTSSFYNLINGVQDPVPPTAAGKELGYIRTVAQQTQQYATVIKDAAAKVTQQVTYPTGNSLADQLKIVARLIKGGLKTRVYMTSVGGFDTHSLQAVGTDTTTGTHSNLLKGVSDAIKAFMDDCKFLSIENRVLGMTFSEFGRRIKSNSSIGTDHGAAAPLFVFGGKVLPGVLGQNPTIPTTVTVNDNVPYQYDFRSVYATILQNWFCAGATTLQAVLFKNFQSLPLVQNAACATGIDDLNRDAGETLVINYPNPFVESTNISFKTKGGHVLIQVLDTQGKLIANLVDKEYFQGKYNVSFHSGNLPVGIYYLRFQNGPLQQVKSMLKVR
jgi:uncharacterized protein (DUF1501 family)